MNEDGRDRPTTAVSPKGLTRRRFLGLTGMWTGALTLGRLVGTRRGHGPAQDDAGTAPATWARHFIDQLERKPPFSFRYGGRPSAPLLARWPHTHQRTPLDANRTAHIITWTDPRTGLAVRCVAVEYHDFPTVEWTLYFKNTGTRPSLPISRVLAIDTTLQPTRAAALVLHSFDGSTASQADYQPYAATLRPNDTRLFTCQGGRPTNGTLPYFNVDWGGEGVIAALGWPGQWTAQMTRDAGLGLHLQAGMSSNDPAQQPVFAIRFAQLVDLWLEPGEEIRTPLIVLQFWQEPDWIAAQNVWRRWMSAHNMPRLPAHPPAPICPTGAVCGYYPGLLDTATAEVMFMNRYVAEHTTADSGGTFDHWWMDAGWYAVPSDATDWTWTGTWQPAPTRYPHGLRPITDRARAHGLKSIVWHEPERVRPGTWLYNHHPEWLLGPAADSDNRLLNLGHPQAWRWVVEHFDQLIREQGVDVYRQDFNIDPLEYWNMADPPRRSGITQIRHVTGYLAFWDELRRRHPHMLIDSCASGGRRNDLETLRRAVPLLRSDYQFEPTGQQCHTYGLSFWMPYYGAGVGPQTLGPHGSYGPGVYVMRSSTAPCFAVGQDVRRATTADWELMRRMTREWREFAADLLGDYYPLTAYDLATDAWMAWQFNRPESGAGVVQAFRRPDNTDATKRFKLRGLDAAATYELENVDVSGTTHATGHDLMTAGLLVRLSTRPAAATIMYRRIGRK